MQLAGVGACAESGSSRRSCATNGVIPRDNDETRRKQQRIVIQRGRDDLTDSASYSSKLWRQLSATASAMAGRKLRRGSQPRHRRRSPEPYIRGRLLEVEHSPRESQQRHSANPSPSRRGERSRVRGRDSGSSVADRARRKWGNFGGRRGRRP
jgi:hypothetical protein